MRIDNLHRHAKKICLVMMTAMLFGGCASKDAEPEAMDTKPVLEAENPVIDSGEEVLEIEEAVSETEEELVYGEPFKITGMPSDMDALANEYTKEGMELYGWQIATGMGSEVVVSSEAKNFLDFLFNSTGGSGEVTMTPVYSKVEP